MASASRNLDNVNLSVGETSPVPGPHVEQEAPQRLPPRFGGDARLLSTQASQNDIGLPLLGAFHAETALNLSELNSQNAFPARLRNGATMGVGGNSCQDEELAGEELAPVPNPTLSPSKRGNPTALGNTASGEDDRTPVILNGTATVTAPSAKPLTPSEDAPLHLDPIELCFDLKDGDEDHGSSAAPDGAPEDQGPGNAPLPPGEEIAPISQVASLLNPPTREDLSCSPAVVSSVAHRPLTTPGAEQVQSRGSPTAAVTPSEKGRGASYPEPWKTKEKLTTVTSSDDEGPSVPDGAEQGQGTNHLYLPLTQNNPVSRVLRHANSQRELSTKVTSVSDCPSVLADSAQQDQTSTHPSTREVLTKKATPASDPCSSRETNMMEVSMGVKAIPGSGPEKEGTEARATDDSRYRANTAKTHPAARHEPQGYFNHVLRAISLFALISMTGTDVMMKTVCTGKTVTTNFETCANKSSNFILRHKGVNVCNFSKCEDETTFRYDHKGCITVHISEALSKHAGIYNLEYGQESLASMWELVVQVLTAKTSAGIVLVYMALQLLLVLHLAMT
ncbi:uncharacterized protein [Heptranchias perlo]|uniref:uncharacterized protein isoform X2 n=1 Tax=Heptranchias perlo TaxID=212740 RepID=UPI003559D18A